jgi:hypothetical protein
MSAFICIALVAMIGLRLAYMFGREWHPQGKPVVVGDEVVHAHVGRGKHRAIDALVVGFDAPSGWRFNFRREGPFDRFAKAIGLAREFQTGDVAFDGRIYIECDDATLHRQLARRELRNAIFSLFAKSAIRSLAGAESRLWFTLSTAGWDKQRSDEEIGRDAAAPLLSHARVLREQMAKPVASDDTSRDPSRVVRRRFAFALLALAIAAGAGLIWQWRHAEHQVVLDHIPRIAAGVTATIVILLLVVMAVTLGGTARAQRVLLDILIAGIPAAGLAAYFGVMYCNESFDESRVRRVPVPVERSWVETSRKGSRYYYAKLRWPDARAAATRNLRPAEYAVLASARCVDVLWREGRFGDGWIEGYETHNSGDCDEGVER